MKHLGLQGKFYDALGDPALTRTEQDLALLDALVANLMGDIPKGKPITEAYERRLSNLTEQRQQAVERKARIERHLGLWIHYTKYQQVMMGVVNVLHDELKLPDGKPDMEKLQRVKARLDLLMMGMATDLQISGEGETEDGE